MEVATIETSCPCTSIQLEQTVVRAGQFLTGRVLLDLRRKPDFVGDLVIEAKGITRKRQVAFVLIIRARVHPANPSSRGYAMTRNERAA